MLPKYQYGQSTIYSFAVVCSVTVCMGTMHQEVLLHNKFLYAYCAWRLSLHFIKIIIMLCLGRKITSLIKKLKRTRKESYRTAATIQNVNYSFIIVQSIHMRLLWALICVCTVMNSLPFCRLCSFLRNILSAYRVAAVSFWAIHCKLQGPAIKKIRLYLQHPKGPVMITDRWK